MKRRPIVLVDIRALDSDHGIRGIGYYVASLVGEILRTNCRNLDFRLLAYSKNNPLVKKFPHTITILTKKPKIHPRFQWVAEQFLTNKVIKNNTPNMFFSPDTNLPLFMPRGVKSIVTIHDLIPIIMKKQYNLSLDRKVAHYIKYKAARSADKIITISKHSKKDIVRLLNVDKKRVDVCYEAADESFKTVSENEKKLIRKKYCQGKKYYLVIGDYYGTDPRKNYMLILDGYAKMVGTDQQKINFKKKNEELPVLLFVGRSGGSNNEYGRINGRALKLRIDKKVIFTGYVQDAELPKIYASASALFYPSAYEGFGLPILQAMASGCPVVTTRATSIPEVAGKAASYCELSSVNSFVKAVIDIEKKRKSYVRAGLIQARKFSWQTCAFEVVKCMEELTSKKRRVQRGEVL